MSIPMGTRMLDQRWIDVEHRRRRCVKNTLDLQTETTSKCRRRIDVAVSTHFKRRHYVVFTLNVRDKFTVLVDVTSVGVGPPANLSATGSGKKFAWGAANFFSEQVAEKLARGSTPRVNSHYERITYIHRKTT